MEKVMGENKYSPVTNFTKIKEKFMYTVKFTDLSTNVSSYSIHLKYVDALGFILHCMESVGWIVNEDYTIAPPMEMTWDEIAKLYANDLLDQDSTVLYEDYSTGVELEKQRKEFVESLQPPED